MGKANMDSPRIKRRKTTDSASPKLNTTSPDVEMKTANLSTTQRDDKTKRLDREIQAGKEFINSILPDIPRDASSEALRRDLRNMLSYATDSKCKLAVFGASGAGKSTLLNALLQDYGVLPTGSMGQACTAVPIEVLWNGSEDIPYKAEIDYITEADWRYDIENARSVLDNGADPVGDASNPIDKVLAVYPQLTEGDLIEMTTDDVLASDDIRNLLGRREVMNYTDRKAFEKELRSKLVPRPSNKVSKKQQAASWPLVSVVRLYVASDILRGGLVLVDVPGVLDSNTSRAMRAKKYIQECSAVCIVAPAIRAGSDATLHGLVDDALRQVQYSNRLDRVVLICTKSDDFNPDEVEADFPDDPAVEELATNKKDAEDEHNYATEQVQIYEQALADDETVKKHADSDISRWRRKSKELREGKAVLPPGPRINGKPVKVDPDAEPITQADIDREIARFQKQKGSAVTRMKGARIKIRGEQAIAKAKKVELNRATIQLNEILLRARNDYLKRTLSTTCAKKVAEHLASIRQAGQGVTAEADAHAAPSIDSECSQITLPVFCVSAVKHMQLCSLRDADASVSPSSLFVDKSDTEIPSLLLHLSKVVTAAQYDMLNSVHTRLVTVLNDLDVYLLQDIEFKTIDPVLAATAVKEASSIIEDVSSRFRVYVEQTSNDIKQAYRCRFIKKIDTAKEFSTKRAQESMPRWTRKGDNGGLYFSEYRAAVARKGVWSGTRRSINFNDDVASEVQNVIYKYMKELFTADTSLTKQALDSCLTKMKEFCEELHASIKGRAIAAGVSAYALHRVDDQLVNRNKILMDIHETAKVATEDIYGTAAIPLGSDIQWAWKRGYRAAKKVSTGTGALQAMHETLSSALVEDDVLKEPIKKLEERLSEGIGGVVQELAVKVNEVATAMVQYYENAMKKREEKAVAVRDPVLNRVRNEMVARGYAKVCGEVKGEEERAKGLSVEEGEMREIMGSSE